MMTVRRQTRSNLAWTARGNACKAVQGLGAVHGIVFVRKFFAVKSIPIQSIDVEEQVWYRFGSDTHQGMQELQLQL